MRAHFREKLAALMTLGVLCLLVFSTSVLAQTAAPSAAKVLFHDVHIFDGRGSRLSGPMDVLVRGGVIERISAATIQPEPGSTVIAGGGRTLMPGLIDNHWHTMFAAASMMQIDEGDLGYLTVLGASEAEATLMRGFTTVRDLGGPSFALKRAIDEGLIPGPRIYPSGAMITITGGHGDFRRLTDLPREMGAPLTMAEKLNASQLADSPDEVRMRTREQLMMGASQIKLSAGGGVASPHSPLDATTFNEDELRAAVEAASNWGTYVTVHAYTPAAIARSIAAGVKVIEHGHLMDDATAKLMADRGIWLSFQPFADDGTAGPMPPSSMLRLQQVVTGTERTVALVKKYRIKMAVGTDILFSRAGATRQNEVLARMGAWFSASEMLAMATGTNAQLLQLSGPRNPYPGKLGVVEEGALADLLLVQGNPLEDLSLIQDPDRNFVVIMKDGVVFKNLLAN